MLTQFSRTELLLGKEAMNNKCTERRDIPGSVAFVPSVAGLILAGEVVKDLCGVEME